MQYLIRSGSRRSIRSFGENLTLNPIRVLGSNLVLGSRRNQHIAFQLQEFTVCYTLHSGIILEGAGGLQMLEGGGYVNALRIIDATMDIGNRHNLITGFVKQLRSDSANVPRSLHHDSR